MCLLNGAIAAIVMLSSGTGWPAATAYFDMSSFRDAGTNLTGLRQKIIFPQYKDENLFTTINYGQERSTVTIGGAKFIGRYLRIGALGLWNYDGIKAMEINLSSGVRALGAYLSSDTSGISSNFTATVTVNRTEQFVFEAKTVPQSTFFGFVSTTPITNLTFSDGHAFLGQSEEQIASVFMIADSVPAPRLMILAQPEFQIVTLAWPAINPGFDLDEKIGGSWGHFLGAQLSGTNWYRQLPLSNDAMFYRLIYSKRGW
jgi:hypothetical protein